MIIFGSVRFLSKKVTKLKFFFEKKIETGSNRPVSVRFFRAKTGSNRFGSVFSVLARFFPVLARFFRFGLVFPVWLGFGSVWLSFFPVFSVSVRFGFFSFLLIKPKPNRPVFLKFNRFNRFFFGSVFSVIYFSVFSV